MIFHAKTSVLMSTLKFGLTKKKNHNPVPSDGLLHKIITLTYSVSFRQL